MELISQAKQVDQLQRKYEKNEKAQTQVKTNLSEQLQIQVQNQLSQKNQKNKQHLKQKQISHTRNQTQFTNSLKKQTEDNKNTWSQKKKKNSISSLHSISNNNSQLSKNVQNSQNSSQNENQKPHSQQYQYNNQFQLRSINSLSTQTETQSYRSYNPEGHQSSNRNIENNINNIYFGNENNSPNFCNSARGKPEQFQKQQQQNFSQSLNLYKQKDLQDGKNYNQYNNNNNGKYMSKLTNLQLNSFEFKKGSKIYDILFQDNPQKIKQKSDYKNQNQKIIESEYIKNHLQKTENLLQQQCRKENQMKFEQDKILQQNLQQISFIPINDDQKQAEQQQKPHNMNQNNDNQICKIKNLQNDPKIQQNNDEQKQQQLIQNRSNVYKQVAFQLNEQNDNDQFIQNSDKNYQANEKNQDLQQQQNEQKKQEYINLCTISNKQLQNMSNQEKQQKLERLQYLKSIFKSLDQDLNTKEFNQNGLEDLRKNSQNRYYIYEKMESQRNTQIQHVKNQFKQFRKNQEEKRANYQAQSFQNSNFNDNKKQSQNPENERQNQEFQNNLSLYNINKQKCQQDIKNAYKSIKQDIKSRELVI